jgi:hypothetical protein
LKSPLLQAPQRLARTLLFYCAAPANTVRWDGNLDAGEAAGGAILRQQNGRTATLSDV